MLPQPDWSLTPEFELLNHRRIGREYILSFIPNVNLCWEVPGLSSAPPKRQQHLLQTEEPDDYDEEFVRHVEEAPRPVKTRDEYVKSVARALEEACLEPMLEPADDVDLYSAVATLWYSTASMTIALPAPTSRTQANVVGAGFNNLDHLYHSIVQCIRKRLSEEAQMVAA